MPRNEPEPFQLHCPLCDNETQIAEVGDLCQVCGAELQLFDDQTVANQFAETCKSRGESVRWRQILNAPFWVVAHKATPPLGSGM